jgi:drug/metabolite transporter (DMT)-like permease
MPFSLSPSAVGILAALVAALTETLLYVFVRWTASSSASTPFTAILQLYPVGLLALLFGFALHPSALDLRPRILLPLFGFNALVGFIGYATRFYTIPKVSTLLFSLLSFVGVLFGYVWGHLLTGDPLRPASLIGSGLIVVSAFLARYQNAS